MMTLMIAQVQDEMQNVRGVDASELLGDVKREILDKRKKFVKNESS